MGYNFRDDNPVLGPNTQIEIPNGASAPTLVKMQVIECVSVFLPAAANAVNQPIFINPPAASVASGTFPMGQYSLVGCSVRFGTASTSGTLQIERTPSATAVGSGTNLLSGTVSLAGTANTVVNGVPSTSLSAANQVLAPGDSLSLIFAGTLTNLANCAITVFLSRTV